MDLNQLCMGCMEIKEDSIVCPNCGFEEGTAPESSVHLPPRTVLHEKYLLGRVLGQGGFGITYLAWDIYLDLKLAVKEYFPRELVYREAGYSTISIHSGTLKDQYSYGLDKFLEEGKTLAKFEGHPNIVSVRDFFKANSTAYLVMNYLEGVTLKDYLKSKGSKLSFDEALQIMMPVMDALRAVHSAGMLHRDVSPDNIFITLKGRVLILDFGAARHALGEKAKNLSIILKPGYAPEEQYRSRGIQGPWTDIYAVAATFYQAITHQMPPESLDRLDHDPIIPPSKLGVQLGVGEEKALLKALSVRAEDRYQTIAQFQEALGKAEQSPPLIYEEEEVEFAQAQTLEDYGGADTFGIMTESHVSPGIQNIPVMERFKNDAFAETINVGRAPDNDVILSDATVSRHHARLYYDSGKWYIVDLGSTHGTFVNGVPAAEDLELAPSSVIQLSGVSLYFEGDRLLTDQGQVVKFLYASSDMNSQRGNNENISGNSNSSNNKTSRTRILIAAALGLCCILILSYAAVMLWGGGKPDTQVQGQGIGVSDISNAQDSIDITVEFGTIEYDGGVYTGELKNGLPHGQGTLVYQQKSQSSGFSEIGTSSGRKYVGQWKDGMKHGQGTMTNPDGSVRRGTWENDYYVGS
ncbi:FHA domain-containing serine/threonine-protein kinase [Candidatus Contubernalis alkaliaceticus]|uniref:FHA domain-containing serine/threonine-protein kinase n=1 Tax=Candidatus Contubernalis alkaliaceticus TaxID=338645 RepID=UPI001F4C2C39|nr:FHA domain-containing serine/threonine-protein kinase [Candidatus Contubernalis alkalaceticus]UNC91460.1 FHA domain-containing protein [Candidatus Contubernalis alkalaceticus]